MKKNSFILFVLAFGFIVLTPSKAQLFNEQGLKYMKLFGWIESQYVDSVNLDKISDNAIKELLRTLDPHSVYFTKDEVREMNEPLQGNFEGIGVTYSLFKDTILVISCFADSPSEKAGIVAGDRIIKINHENVAGIGITKQIVQSKLRGKKGTDVNISVLRRGVSEAINYVVTRDKIALSSIDASYLVDDKTGYLRLSRFSATSFEEITKVFKGFKSKGIEDIILDLSGNTGGYLDIAVSLADEFLDKDKIIVYTSGIHVDKREYFSTNGGLFEKGKLVIIIDENSASASEIVAGAIQDWDRGVIIGRRSYGKGLVQRPFTFPDGSMIRLTIARYYTPSGRLIQKSYTNGYKEYNKELGERAKTGEIFGNDSKKTLDSLKYYTLMRKREVFGGGGITPDVPIPIDTNRFSKLYLNLNSKGLFNSFSISYIDVYRNSIKAQYASFNEFKAHFEVDSRILGMFTTHCNEQNVKIAPAELEKSKKHIAIAIKANIALEMWSSSEFYEITNITDPDFMKALEVFNNWNKFTH